MGNLKEINRVAHKYNIPLVFDTARWLRTLTSSR